MKIADHYYFVWNDKNTNLGIIKIILLALKIVMEDFQSPKPSSFKGSKPVKSSDSDQNSKALAKELFGEYLDIDSENSGFFSRMGRK